MSHTKKAVIEKLQSRMMSKEGEKIAEKINEILDFLLIREQPEWEFYRDFHSDLFRRFKEAEGSDAMYNKFAPIFEKSIAAHKDFRPAMHDIALWLDDEYGPDNVHSKFIDNMMEKRYGGYVNIRQRGDE